MQGRYDVTFNLPAFREHLRRLRERHPGAKSLSEYADVVCGPFGTAIKLDDYAGSGVPLLRISNITDDGRIDESDLVFISSDLASKFTRSSVEPGDLVISQRGTLGVPAVVPASHPLWCISANLIAIKRATLPADYLQAYLSYASGAVQLRRAQSGQVQAKITTGDVASVVVPKVANVNVLIAALDVARAARRRKLEEAESLLAGLDAFVLEALGLELPPPDAHRTTYAIRLADVRDGRKLYPDYFHPERLNAIRAVERQYKGDRCATLLSVAEFRRDQRRVQPDDHYLGLANVQPKTGERVENTEGDGEGTVFVYAQNDVLFARLRPYLNKVYRAESSGVCSPEFHVMRVRSGADGMPRVIPDYLAAVLRSGLVLSQTRHMMTGNTHPRLANDDVVNLVVPIPDSTTQKKIADEVLRRRDVARRLREDADKLWADAKWRFEEELLGPAQ